MHSLIEQQPAWLLHSRPFRDTSLLLDFITPGHGRLSAIARGARGAKSRTRALLQPFRPLFLSASGRSELLSLRTIEPRGPALPLQGERLFSGLYLNELLVRLLQGHESDRALFELYDTTLLALASDMALEALLRQFELRLLDLLGYGLQFMHEADSAVALEPEAWYYLRADSGFVRQQALGDTAALQMCYPGHELLRIAETDFSRDSTRHYAKRLLRQALQLHLAERPLASRQLFRQSKRRNPD